MTVADLLAGLFWPVVLGLIFWCWLLRAQLLRAWGDAIVPLAGAALVGGVAIIYTVIFGVASLVVLFDVFLGMILFGALCLFALYAGWQRLTTGYRVLLGLFGPALMIGGAIMMIGDYVRPRLVVEGPIERLYIRGTATGWDEYTVRINGQFYQATTRLYATLKQGERVRAEIGRASNFIYRIDRKTP